MICFIGFIVFLWVCYQVYQYWFPAPNVDSDGKYVLISGCDSGFGNMLAIELDRLGFHVLAGVYQSDSQNLLNQQLSSRATIFQLDITKQENIDAAYDLVEQKTKNLHALVNNAGISTGGHIDWISTESIRQTMDINFFGHVAMTKKFLPLLLTKSGSRVVNITSIAGFLSPPSAAAYCASKYALESFSDCLRREMKIWNLHVSIIEPGIMRTPIIKKHGQAANEVRMELPADVRERWGDEFIKNHYENLKNNILIKYAEDPMKVVLALQHAVTSTAPCIRYKPGWQSKFVYYPLSIIPAWMTDFYFFKVRGVPVIPTGVTKQS